MSANTGVGVNESTDTMQTKKLTKLDGIREGMRVADHEGNKVGFVADMKMGDPSATTADGQNKRDDHSIGVAAISISSPAIAGLGIAGPGSDEFLDVPHEHAVRLLRLGYIKVQRHHLLGSHFFVASDGIDRVEEDTVHLRDLEAAPFDQPTLMNEVEHGAQ